MPLPYLLLSLALQAALIVHCIKTGRNQIWIWVLLMLSMVGVVAYVAAELIPELLRSRSTQRTVRGVKKVLDPEANLRRYEQLSRGSDNVDSRQRHAEELLRLKRYPDVTDPSMGFGSIGRPLMVTSEVALSFLRGGPSRMAKVDARAELNSELADLRDRARDYASTLFQVRTGIFAGSPAVNPMLTCMALADRVASGIVEGR